MNAATQGPFMVERHDRNDGVIVYELWTADYKELVLSIADDFNSKAKADAELICHLLNNQHPVVAETDAVAPDDTRLVSGVSSDQISSSPSMRGSEKT